ncbi:hypothetical protein Droror1_Dr00013823 [Drosera rotundifolia]
MPQFVLLNLTILLVVVAVATTTATDPAYFSPAPTTPTPSNWNFTCRHPTHFLDACQLYLQTGDEFFLNTRPFIILGMTCCESFTFMKEWYMAARFDEERRQLCNCVKAECQIDQNYNWDRVSMIQQYCNLEPMPFEVSRSVTC